VKITIETKFEKGQSVFVVWNNSVESAIVEQCGFFGGRSGNLIVNYLLSGYFKEGKGYASVTKCFFESEVFGTWPEAAEALRKNRRSSIDDGILQAKSKICDVARRWCIRDCQNFKQEEILRTLKKWNSELGAMMKGEGK